MLLRERPIRLFVPHKPQPVRRPAAIRKRPVKRVPRQPHKVATGSHDAELWKGAASWPFTDPLKHVAAWSWTDVCQDSCRFKGS